MADPLYSPESAFSLLTTYGYALPNRYFVTLYNLPSNLSNMPIMKSSDQGRLKFACESVDMPTRNITTEDLKIGHHTRKSAIGYTVDPIKITYRCSRDMAEKTFFDAWIDLICDPKTGSMEYHSKFTCDLVIDVLDGGGDKVYGVKLIEAFPMAATANGLSYMTLNEILKFDVQFACTKIEFLPYGANSSQGGQSGGLDSESSSGGSGNSQQSINSNTNASSFDGSLQQNGVSPFVDPDGVLSRKPQIEAIGNLSKQTLNTLLIPTNNPAYDWNKYLSTPKEWGTNDPIEALSKIALAKTDILSPLTKNAIMTGGVSSWVADSAVTVLSNQTDSVSTLLENISPLTASF